jgi:hypothetical protein
MGQHPESHGDRSHSTSTGDVPQRPARSNFVRLTKADLAPQEFILLTAGASGIGRVASGNRPRTRHRHPMKGKSAHSGIAEHRQSMVTSIWPAAQQGWSAAAESRGNDRSSTHPFLGLTASHPRRTT